MRTRKKSYTTDELSNNTHILHAPADNKGKWSEHFKNSNPIYIEIGCGKGSFVDKLSHRETDINFVALEREREVIVMGAKTYREQKEVGEHNGTINFILGDATNLLDYFAPKEVSRIYLNFSDPWPFRKKWAKRRLTHKNFLDIYKQILTDSGEIHFKTDNLPLFEFSLNEFSKENWSMKNIALDLHSSEFHTSGENIMTEYEQKFSAKGMNIFRLEASFRGYDNEK